MTYELDFDLPQLVPTPDFCIASKRARVEVLGVHHGSTMIKRESSENHDFPRSMVNPKVLQTQGSSQSL